MTSRQMATTTPVDQNLHQVIKAFSAACLRHNISGVQYRFDSRNLRVVIGNDRNAPISAKYNLYLSGHYLGDLRLYGEETPSETTLKQIESLVSVLTLKLSSLLAEANRDGL